MAECYVIMDVFVLDDDVLGRIIVVNDILENKKDCTSLFSLDFEHVLLSTKAGFLGIIWIFIASFQLFRMNEQDNWLIKK